MYRPLPGRYLTDVRLRKEGKYKTEIKTKKQKTKTSINDIIAVGVTMGHSLHNPYVLVVKLRAIPE